MSIKTIFKTLIGTVVTIIIISLCIELFNVNVSGMEIRSACTMSAKQAAELFTQETYKNEGDSRAVNLSDIKTNSGTTYISGKFYGNDTSASGIWNKLYGSSNDTFKKVCTMTKGSTVTASITVGGKKRTVSYKYKYASSSVSSNAKSDGYPWAPHKNSDTPISAFKELGQLYAGIHDTTNVSSAASASITYQQFESGAAIVKQKSYAIAAQKMRTKLYTPVNIGFPYFDPDVTNKVFQWDLAKILTNDDPTLIKKDNDGKLYVNYKGFRCYVQDAYINKFNYYILDAKTDSSKISELVNMSSSQLKKMRNSKRTDLANENNYITVVGIEYTIPIAYQGVTPLKKIIEYSWNSEVKGNKGNKYNSVETDRSGMTGAGTLTDNVSNMTNSTSAANGALSTTGELNYILVR